MYVKIRKAVFDDVYDISKIYALSWKTAYRGIVPQKYLDELKNDFWVSAFENWISNDILSVQVICEDNIPVGCIAYGNSRDDKFKEWGEIVSIYLLPQCFRKGYGNKLLKSALDDMKIKGFKNCYLWVLKENSNGRAFYEANGFVCNNDEYICEIMNKKLADVRYILKDI